MSVLSDEGLDDQTWWANVLRGEPDPALDLPDHVWDAALGGALEAGAQGNADLIPGDDAAADDEGIDSDAHQWSGQTDDLADQVGDDAGWSDDYGTGDDEGGFE